jgi:hypothetical protein
LLERAFTGKLSLRQVSEQQCLFLFFMRPINKDELYDNLREFLKTKGVNLQNGSYSRGIHAGCSFLADAINLSQAGLNRAKTQIEKQLDNARQIIHDKTAPKGRTRSGRAGGGQKENGTNTLKTKKTGTRAKGKRSGKS